MDLNLILNIISTVGTVIMTVLGIYTLKILVFRDRYFGDRAVDEFKKLNLKDKDLIDSYEFNGGNRIFPQIIIEKRIFNKTVSYYYKEGDKRMVKVWNLNSR